MLDLLQFMQQDGYLSAQELVALRKTSKELGESPVRLLRSLNIASPEQIQLFLQKHFKVLLLKEEALAELGPNHQIFVPLDIAIFYSCFGIGEENGITYIAMEDPSDRGVINQLRFLLSKRIVGVCATVYQIAEGLTKIYNLQITNLKLTTPIEKSRGVIGGIRYATHQQMQQNQENEIQIDENFAGVGLTDASSTTPLDSPTSPSASPEEKSAESKPEQEPPAFDFIDGSSGTVDPKLLESSLPTESSSSTELTDSDGSDDGDLFAQNSPISASTSNESMAAESTASESIGESTGGSTYIAQNNNISDNNTNISDNSADLENNFSLDTNDSSENNLDKTNNNTSIEKEENNESNINKNDEPNDELGNNELLSDETKNDELGNDILISDENKNIDNSNVISVELRHKISSITNIALTKLALLNKKEDAYKMLNNLLSSLNINNVSIENINHNEGMENKEVIKLIEPVLKKIEKLRN